MEAAIVNAVEPGEKILILENGVWSVRATDIAERCGTRKPCTHYHMDHVDHAHHMLVFYGFLYWLCRCRCSTRGARFWNLVPLGRGRGSECLLAKHTLGLDHLVILISGPQATSSKGFVCSAGRLVYRTSAADRGSGTALSPVSF